MKSSNIERPFRMLKQPIFLCILFFASAGAVQADKIYTIGDSITRGTTYDFDSADYPLSAYRNGSGSPPNDIRSYREHLHDLLVEDPSCDATVEWVGTKDEPNRIPVYHEGRSGWRADEIINRTWAQDGTTTPKIGIDGWLGEFQPDHVLIHLGTNDMQQGQSAESTRDDINSLLDTVYAERPNATVFLANVIPIFGWWANHVNNDAYDPTADTSAFPGVGTVYPEADVAGEAQQLSSLIGSLVTTRSNNGDDIHLVDVNSTFYVNESNVTNCSTGVLGDPTNMSTSLCKDLPDGSGMEPDGIHPNLVGDKFIADQFFNAISANTSLCSSNGVDTSAPTVQINTPASAGVTLPSVATLSGSAADNGDSGFASVDVAVRNASNEYLNFATGTFGSAVTSAEANLTNTSLTATDWSINTQGLADGTYTVEVTASDLAGNTSSTLSRSFQVGQTTGGALYQEAESGTLSGDMAIVSDASASSGQYVTVPGSGAVNAFDHYVEFTVNIETAGSYQINAGVRSLATDQNSFFAQVNGTVERYEWHIPSTSEWLEDAVSDRVGSDDIDVVEDLDVGTHTLRVYGREAGAQLDWIEFALVGSAATSDTTAPTVQIATPASAGAILPSIATLEGTASDTGGSEFDSVDVAVLDASGNYLNFGTGMFDSTSITVEAYLSNTSPTATDWLISTPALADGNYTIEVTASDLAGNNSNVISRSFQVGQTTGVGGGGGGGALYQEAESGALFGDMKIVSDTSASDGQFVEVPGTGAVNDYFAHYVEFSVDIATMGSYRIKAGVRGPSGQQNSFFAQINEGDRYVWHIPSNNQLEEDIISDRLNSMDIDIEEILSPGEHTLRVYGREAGAQLDWIEFELVGGGNQPDNVDPTAEVSSPADGNSSVATGITDNTYTGMALNGPRPQHT